jgi:hypothetical protein
MLGGHVSGAIMGFGRTIAVLIAFSTFATSAAEPTIDRVAFALVAPTEFQGQWERPAAPFVNPIETRNWVNVRIEKMTDDGHVHGKVDFYVRSICYDLVDEPFDGTFDGSVLELRVEYSVCPLMKPLRLRLWKEADGFHARANWWPITIQHVNVPRIAETP